MKGNKKWYKNKIIWFSIAVILAFILGDNLGNTRANKLLDEEKVTYDQLRGIIYNKRAELTDIYSDIDKHKQELKEVTDEINKNKRIIDEAKEIVSKKEDIEKSISSNTSKLNKLKREVEIKEKELSKLTGQLKNTGESPVELNAGYYYFGDDLPANRYELKAQNGYHGNVFVKDESGRSKVAETFGKGPHAIESFVFTALPGDEIEATIPVILTPVE